MHHWVVPQPMWKKMEEEKVAKELGSVTKKEKQLKLDFKAVTHVWKFTRANTLHAVAKLITTNQQVSVRGMESPVKRYNAVFLYCKN